MERRLLTAAGAIGLGLLLLLGRLVQLTTVQGAGLAREAATQHQHRITLTPRRGAIVDRNGTPLALSVPAESLFVRPNKLPPDAKTLAPALAATLHMPTREVTRLLHSSAPFVWLKRRATPQEAARVRALGIPGIDSLEAERRFYPQGTLAAPLLGFTSIDAMGLEGIELAYDHYLRGESIEVLGERDALGRTILARGVENRPEALNVRLTIDAGLQYLAERELKRAVQASGALAGTVVMLDPQTSAVLALAQVPTFDPNTPAASSVETRRNRAITDCYEPGSTLKALLAAAALDTKVVRPEERVFCELGQYKVGKHIINDHHPYGWLSFTQVLQKSSNIGISKIGERVGKETYETYLRAFGLGRVTGVDLPGEIPGLLFPLGAWSHINLVTASFGQGIAVTPLQLATAYAALANGGVLMRPYIVSEVLNAEGKVVVANGPQRLWQVVRTDTAHRLLALLEKVVEKEGTGWRAQIEGFRVAGKTGTSQKVSPHGGYAARGRIASFVGVVPADRPRLVILVAIDEPKTSTYGGEIAAPVFQAIAQHALMHLGIEGQKGQTGSAVAAPLENQLLVHQVKEVSPTMAPSATVSTGEPNFLGLSLREAMHTAQRQGWRLTTTGNGYVAHQIMRSDPETREPVYALTLTPSGETRP